MKAGTRDGGRAVEERDKLHSGLERNLQLKSVVIMTVSQSKTVSVSNSFQCKAKTNDRQSGIAVNDKAKVYLPGLDNKKRHFETELTSRHQGDAATGKKKRLTEQDNKSARNNQLNFARQMMDLLRR